MAPKRKAEKQNQPGQPPSKPLKEDVQFDERWKTKKPSLIYIGDDLEHRQLVAAFDFDNTLVEWIESVPVFSTAPDSWEFWNDKVVSKLQVCQLVLACMRAWFLAQAGMRVCACCSVRCMHHVHVIASPVGLLASSAAVQAC